MVYRRMMRPRRYPHMNFGHGAAMKSEPLNEVVEIPMPNEIVEPPEPEPPPSPQQPERTSILPGFLKNIQLEELLLIGLIFVLLQEGIDDEFLLLMLVFILLSGR